MCVQAKYFLHLLLLKNLNVKLHMRCTSRIPKKLKIVHLSFFIPYVQKP